MRLYLDACCLNRPFDDPSIDRNRLESEAVLTILRRIHRGNWQMIGSEAIDIELGLSPNADKRAATRGFLALQADSVRPTERIFVRADEVMQLGLTSMDALHVACAEAGRCDVLLTTDDKMLKRLKRHASSLRVRVENPLEWITEQMTHDDHRNDTE